MTVLFGGSSATIAQVLADAMSKELGVPVAAVSRTGAGSAVGLRLRQVETAQRLRYRVELELDQHRLPQRQHRFRSPDFRARGTSGHGGAGAGGTRRLRLANAQGVCSGRQDEADEGGYFRQGLLRPSGLGGVVRQTGHRRHLRAVRQGTAPTELLGGRVDAALQWPSQFKAQVDADQLRVIAVTGSDRVPVLPDVPTAIEQGYDVDMVMWRGLAAPKGTPTDVIARLETAARRVVSSPRFREISAHAWIRARLPARQRLRQADQYRRRVDC